MCFRKFQKKFWSFKRSKNYKNDQPAVASNQEIIGILKKSNKGKRFK